MKVPPNYQITPEILELISKINSYKIFFSSIKINVLIKNKLQRISLLKSSLFSARIEGNPLNLTEIETTSNKEKKIEIVNILKATKFIEKSFKGEEKITKKNILRFHSIVMKELSPEAGRFRREMGAIFNQAGIAIYLAPPPEKISLLIENLINYIKNSQERFSIIKALITHLVFEKIHPFIDGNGRVGRLLIYAVLKINNDDFSFFVPFEEYLDKYKSDYYYFLDQGLKDTNGYLIFMLKAFINQLEKTKEEIVQEINKKEIIFLPPRQEEITQIIKDQRTVSFDFICRRFLKIPKRTLRYDLKKLVDKKLIIKIGKTKGSFYKI